MKAAVKVHRNNTGTTGNRRRGLRARTAVVAKTNLLKRFPPPADRRMPKHSELCESLIAAISAGYWPPGTKLPTEAELVAITPYSLGTVQRALRTLVERGFVVRRRGYGTYVPDRRKQLDSPWHCRFLTDDGKKFLPVFPKVLRRSVTRARGPWSVTLEQDEQPIVRIDRRMEIADEFSVYSKFFARADRFPQLIELPIADLDGANLKILVARSIGLPLTALRELLRVDDFPPAICRAIGVKAGVTGIVMEATAYAGAGTPVYYQELYIPPTHRRLYLESKVPASL